MTAAAALTPEPARSRVPVSTLRRRMPEAVFAHRKCGRTLHLVDDVVRRTRCGRRLTGAALYRPGFPVPPMPVCRVCLRGLSLVLDPDREELAAMHHARMIQVLQSHAAALAEIRGDMIADGSHQQMVLVDERFDRVTTSTDFTFKGKHRRHHADMALLVGSKPKALTLSGLLAESRPRAFRLIPSSTEAPVSPW